MHRRKTSKETVEQENLILDDSQPDTTPFPTKLDNSSPIPFPNGSERKADANGLPEIQLPGGPLKTRMNSLPSDTQDEYVNRRPPPASAGPYRTSFGSLAQTPPPNGYAFPASPLRKSFRHGHGRTLSSSGASLQFAPPMLSPPPHHSGHFPSRSISMAGPSPPGLNGSPPEGVGSPRLPSTPGTPPSTRRHHQRIHSRNLSVFFPRPGSLPTSSIAEDSDVMQEATITLNDSPQIKSVRLQDPPGPRRLGEGFTFGGRPERTPSTSSSDDPSPGMPMQRSKRRGHHHKHSVSHNFFSFLEPGASLRPSSSPEQTWTPTSPGLGSRTPSSSTFAQAQSETGTAVGLTSPNPDPLTRGSNNLLRDTTALSVIQFVLGAALWVSGQQIGSLACTGLGYWVVFDSFGVALRHVLPAYLSSESMQSKTRRPYGNGRVETLFLFAQTIYLIFSSVYVSKEAVEHLLLAAGDGHYHHPRDEDIDIEGMRLSIFLVLTTIVSLLSTCLFYDNHRRLMTTSGHRLPSFSRIFYRSRYSSFNSSAPTSIVLSNPFTIAPLMFSVALLAGAILLPAPQQESYDLLLALFEAVLTFKIAYPAVEVQGAVLLQTSPPRGLPGARMEGFLRVMREIERHPLVLHLPPPHIWQLTPSATTLPPRSLTSFKSPSHYTDTSSQLDALVVTLELHVRRDTDDSELLALTRWAHDRCRIALGLGIGAKDRDDDDDGTEITIGIVKG